MATNQSSPGVVIQERDLTTVSTIPTANVGVIAAPFTKGPVEEVIEITSERQLAEKFGEPNESNYEYWFSAAQFLSYGGLLKTIRVNSSSLKNAVDTGTAPLVKNLQDYETSIEEASNNFSWVARTPGDVGNSIGIFMTDSGADQIAVVPAPGSGNDHMLYSKIFLLVYYSNSSTCNAAFSFPSDCRLLLSASHATSTRPLRDSASPCGCGTA